MNSLFNYMQKNADRFKKKRMQRFQSGKLKYQNQQNRTAIKPEPSSVNTSNDTIPIREEEQISLGV